jgi:hypothetical protein
MQPVVVDPAITFTQLVSELVALTSDEERSLARDQLLASSNARNAISARSPSATSRPARGCRWIPFFNA